MENEGRLLADEDKHKLEKVALIGEEGTGEDDSTDIAPRYFTRPPIPRRHVLHGYS